MFVIVSYDMPDNKRRSRVAKAIKGYGFRVQESVFECHVDQREFDEMRKELESIIVESDDSIRIYRLCGNCQTGIQVIGLGEVTAEEDVVVL